jgi:uncharacterized FlaG/YvyC family protein
MRRRRDGKHSPQKKNSIQDLKGNEENGYLVRDLNKTMMNVTKELNYAHEKKKKNLKQEIWENRSEEFIKKILDMVRTYKMHSRNFKTPKINNMKWHRNKRTQRRPQPKGK